MKRSERDPRRWLQGWAVLVMMLTLSVPLLLGVHEHTIGHHDGACLVCTCAHAHAIDQQSVTAAEPPRLCATRIAMPLSCAVLPTLASAARSRAPPRV